MHFWQDAATKMTLAHVYEKAHWFHHLEEKHIFSLRDYNRKLHWSGVWNYTTQKVSNCRLQVFDRPFEAYCMARNVELEGSGTVSKDSKVDFYKGRYTDE